MKKEIVISIMAAWITLLSACHSETGNTHNSGKTDATFQHAYLKQAGDSLLVPVFEITLNLSEAAERLLAERKETIIVAAYFSGKPLHDTPEKYKGRADEIDGLNLGTQRIELEDKRSAVFNSFKFHTDLFTLLKNPDIEVLINVYSGRRSGPDNLLSCDILQDKLSSVAGKSFELKGKLIEEQ